jgi:Cu(I)/Ag(I) efflux system membrane protein CusA/SilA
MTAVVFRATTEVSSAIVTSVSTTLISFLPIFMMEGAEGKLFAPLAFTKTAALFAALLVVLFILPTLATWTFGLSLKFSHARQRVLMGILLVGGLGSTVAMSVETGVVLMLSGLLIGFQDAGHTQRQVSLGLGVLMMLWLLTRFWMPLPLWSVGFNFLFVLVLVGGVLGGFYLLRFYYASILRWCLHHRIAFMSIPITLIAVAIVSWFGFARVLSPVSSVVGPTVEHNFVWKLGTRLFPGMEDEFMPPLDEGTFLLMPTSMPHAGMAHNKEVIQQLDMLVGSVPEVEMVVGKLGRAETALDPAPISMYENIIQYQPEFHLDEDGRRQRFQASNGRFYLRSGQWMSNQEILEQGVSLDELIPDSGGQYFRNWRESIQSADDIWNEIVRVAEIPGMTSAPKLQPIETRLVMLQTGMRASMGIKVYGADLKTIEAFGRSLEQIVQTVPTVKTESVFADRIVGKPYLLLDIDRSEIARYGLTVDDLQTHISAAIGGMQLTSTVEGRERFPVTIRYPRELRNDPEQMMRVLVTTPSGAQVPLGDLVHLEYEQGPQMIKTEDTFLVSYVLFDKRSGHSDVSVVRDVQEMIQHHMDAGLLTVPNGVHFEFSGSYENQQRAAQRLQIIVPLALVLVLLLLYLQFRSWWTAGMVFGGVAMSFAGAFILLWLVAQDWFLTTPLDSLNLREIFHVQTTNLSVAVWVGFVALFGIATDDGVLMGTYLDQLFDQRKPSTQAEIWDAVVTAGEKRITPAIMTSATTIIALLPILTSTGRGADIMIPMAIPVFGGMLVASITYFIVPVLYSWRAEVQIARKEGA